MRGCDPEGIAAKLGLAMEALQHARASTTSQWDDAMRRAWEQEYLAPLEPKVRRALDAMRHLAEVLSKAERECS